MDYKEKIVGSLVGLAVGDAIGLPYERILRERQHRMSPKMNTSLVLGRNMFSDDTEHMCIVIIALLESKGDPEKFTTALAKKLRWWLLGLPGGIGRATLRSTIKLWLGFSPQRSGVFSAGNGPAMRSPILGLLYGHDFSKLRELVSASTTITHTDPKAFHGALAVALATHLAAEGKNDPADFWPLWEKLCPEATQLSEILRKVETCILQGNIETLRSELGCERSVTGYMYHTIPFVFYFWWQHPEDFATALEKMIKCGGDSDTNAAILGAIIGAHVGIDNIPLAWRQKAMDWPRSLQWIIRLSDHLPIKTEEKNKIPRLNPLFLFLRNIFFLMVILVHGFRRMLPPY